MGYEKRAGFYSYDSLEWLFGARRSREIHVDVSVPVVGDEIPFYPGMPLTVAQVDAPHALVFWQLSSHGKALDPTGPRPDDYMLWSWAFVLQEWSPLQTRLVTRMRATYEPRWKWAPYARFVLSPAHWIMGRRGLIGIRDRAEHELDAAMEAPGVQDAGRRRTTQHRRDADERALVR